MFILAERVWHFNENRRISGGMTAQSALRRFLFFILFLLYVSSFQWISGNNSVTLHHELKCKKQ
ncbi:hypothetical protein DXA11_16100 [Bacteroides sp. AM56-10ce]|nr:hypothetical protein DXA11_16100 [Bacteroides sp. AM56-10ce]HCJ23955.1 hypothetical protein [Bacteroides ovatus]